ncbi:PEP-CTERM sorting domain-containing protein [Gloeothece verrucosa]|uniref:PEP-CTERM protein-sorting domain-containing protein n=1 Tax=Gloeothece verrucosa (strain PCC 7822) TaxID=497965 RepID=E0UNM7_GLOV7|nr:PEP-CTERM sorting domain-containing protein [Gloeothece verrucosa]ADN18557.1 hypothetical protein Cyan7822_6916 [Gloeothece verrucosa PCC 7822]
MSSSFFNQTSSVVFSWNFAEGAAGWQGGFADYPSGEETFYELNFSLRPLPSPLVNNQALWITGNNHSDDLFMYFRNQVSGLTPSTTYQVTFNVELASDAPDGSIGIGGSPANSVYLKAGATTTEPIAMLAPSSNFLLLNVDKGNQAQGGRDAVVLGDVAKPDDGKFDYALIERSNVGGLFTFRTDNTGSAWLYFGTDSGYEGTTSVYYTNFTAQLAVVPEPLTLAGVCTAVSLGVWFKRLRSQKALK